MEVKYKNNMDKFIYLGFPLIFLVISLISGFIMLLIFTLVLTIAISSVLFQYTIAYYRHKVVISIKNGYLDINSNGKYHIAIKDIIQVYSRGNQRKVKKLYILFNKKGKQQKIYLNDLYDVSLETIESKLKTKIKKRV